MNDLVICFDSQDITVLVSDIITEKNAFTHLTSQVKLVVKKYAWLAAYR